MKIRFAAASACVIGVVGCAPPAPPEPPRPPVLHAVSVRGPITAPASPPAPFTRPVVAVDQRAISEYERDPFWDRDVSSMTRERCAREARCGNLGPEKRFASRDACLAVLGRSDAVVFGTSACDPGVRAESGLRACRAAIRNQACSSLLDSLEVLPACQSENVCRD